MDWIGAVLDVFGKLFTARKLLIGWVVYLASNIAWIIWALHEEVWSLFSLEALHLILNCYAIFYWKYKTR